MKKSISYTLALAACLCVFSSCSDDEEAVVSGFSIDKETLAFGENGSTEALEITTDAQWQGSTEAAWLHLQPGNGTGSALCQVKADSSILATSRTAEIRFIARGHNPRVVQVTQMGYKKEIVLEKQVVELKYSDFEEERFFELSVTSNVDFDVQIPTDGQWVTFDNKQKVDLDYKDRPRTKTFRFGWEVNMNEEARETVVTFAPKNEGTDASAQAQPVTLTVKQAAAPQITDTRAGDSLAVIAIYEALDGMYSWDTSENMRHWDIVEMWEATDLVDGKPISQVNPDLVGRLKSVRFSVFTTGESLPYQVKYLKTARSIYFSGNANHFTKNIDLGTEILELAENGKGENGKPMLRELTIHAYGLKSVPDDFADKFGPFLEYLDLGYNNFEADMSSWLNRRTFPALRTLLLNSMRRVDSVRDLQNPPTSPYGKIGLLWNTQSSMFKELLNWDELERLSISVGFLDGELPTDDQLLSGEYDRYGHSFSPYTEDDLTALKDTINADGKRFLIGNVARVWPNMRQLAINLNFLTGNLPNWILYHPNLGLWDPFTLVFNQEIGTDTDGNRTGTFDNEPTNLNYYYRYFPGRRPVITDGSDQMESGNTTAGETVK